MWPNVLHTVFIALYLVCYAQICHISVEMQEKIHNAVKEHRLCTLKELIIFAIKLTNNFLAVIVLLFSRILNAFLIGRQTWLVS